MRESPGNCHVRDAPGTRNIDLTPMFHQRMQALLRGNVQGMARSGAPKRRRPTRAAAWLHAIPIGSTPSSRLRAAGSSHWRTTWPRPTCSMSLRSRREAKPAWMYATNCPCGTRSTPVNHSANTGEAPRLRPNTRLRGTALGASLQGSEAMAISCSRSCSIRHCAVKPNHAALQSCAGRQRCRALHAFGSADSSAARG